MTEEYVEREPDEERERPGRDFGPGRCRHQRRLATRSARAQDRCGQQGRRDGIGAECSAPDDELVGDFDITFELVDRTQNYVVGVTIDTLPAALLNYNILDFGVSWVTDALVTVYEDTVATNHAVPTWGNGLVRLVRTGANIDLYINNVIVAAANNPAFTTAPVRRVDSAHNNVASECVLFGDLSVPIAIGSNLVQTNTALPDENGTETVAFSATAVFNFAIDPRKNKKMTLTANATGLIVLAPTPGKNFS